MSNTGISGTYTQSDISEYTDDDLQTLCLALAKADDEEVVKEKLEEIGVWDDDRYWRDYGDDDGNFSDIGNQQARPLDALVEKLVNAIDAKQLRAAKAEGIDVENRFETPGSMAESSEQFFGVEDGDLTTLSAEERTELAKSIAVVASGEKGRGASPTYSVIDDGEGQQPDDFPTTFLSLDESNKLRIPFVTGKFNMGGTGVLPFCGDKNVQLIVSRRAPDLVAENDARPWGFTIVRRFDPSEIGDESTRARNPVYRYLVVDGEVPRFEAESLPLRPSDKSHPQQCSATMDYGTFVKLYNYETPASTNLILDPHYRLAARLPSPVLPIRLYETRDYTGNTLQATLSGLNVRLHDDRNKNIESGFPASNSITVGDSKFGVRIFAITPQESNNRNVKRYRQAGDGIILTLNGQAHGSFHERFFSRQNVGMGYLKDSLVVMVDCDEISQDDRAKLFMNSRDRLRDSDFSQTFEKELERLLGNHQGLIDLRDNRQQDELERSLQEDSPLTDALGDIIEDSPSLSSLFVSGEGLQNPSDGEPDPDGEEEGGGTDEEPEEPFEGERFPTFFDVVEPHKERTVPKNANSVTIRLETDAENDYFERGSKQGSFVASMDGEQVSNYSLSLWNGEATLQLELNESNVLEGVELGSKLRYNVAIHDPSRRENPLLDQFELEVGPEQEFSKADSNQNNPGSDDGNDPLEPQGLSIPEPIFVEREDWDEYNHEFTEDEAMFVEWLGEETGYRFYVNGGNRFLEGYLEHEAEPGHAEVIKSKFKYSLMLLGLAMLSDLAEERGLEGGMGQYVQTPDDEPEIEEKINEMARGAARVMLPTLERLDDLESPS
jgi:hypothetical protein